MHHFDYMTFRSSCCVGGGETLRFCVALFFTLELEPMYFLSRENTDLLLFSILPFSLQHVDDDDGVEESDVEVEEGDDGGVAGSAPTTDADDDDRAGRGVGIVDVTEDDVDGADNLLTNPSSLFGQALA